MTMKEQFTEMVEAYYKAGVVKVIPNNITLGNLKTVLQEYLTTNDYNKQEVINHMVGLMNKSQVIELIDKAMWDDFSGISTILEANELVTCE